MSAVFGDTYFFLALLVANDDAHERANTILDTLNDDLYTTTWILTEVGDALCAPGNRPLFVSLLEFLQSHPSVTVLPAAEDLFQNGIDLYRSRPDKKWSLTDCISFCAMMDHGIDRALTGDHHFQQAGFVALMA